MTEASFLCLGELFKCGVKFGGIEEGVMFFDDVVVFSTKHGVVIGGLLGPTFNKSMELKFGVFADKV